MGRLVLVEGMRHGERICAPVLLFSPGGVMMGLSKARKGATAMKNVLVTGGTTFVSRFVAEYFVKKGDAVFVINRGSKAQSAGVRHIRADRHALGDSLRGMHFDLVVDVTAYTAEDVNLLLDALDSYGDYVLISSSAVYPETAPQPFPESTALGLNRFWGKYGTDKIEAEEALHGRDPRGYILRPPYLYGPMNNVYREAFVFECAEKNRPFYLPGDGGMQLQFFHVEDLCRFVDALLEQKPEERIYNVGNPETVSVREWVELCYRATGKQPEFVNVHADVEQRKYFSFYNYEYKLDVSRQQALMPDVKPLADGLREAFAWWRENPDGVVKKPLMEFIDRNL